MAVFSVNNIKIIGMSACVPKQEDNNWNYNILSEQEKKLLIKTTGIEKKELQIIYHYQEALRIDSTYLTSINNLGSVYVNFLQDYEKAINYCSKAVTIDSSYVEAHINLAFSYHQLGKHDLALTHYVKVIELTPENMSTYEKFMNIARDSENAQLGVNLLKNLEGKIPDSKVLFVSLANLYSLLPNSHEFTIYYFEKAFQLDPSDKQLCTHIHRLHLNAGNFERANQYFEACK